MTRVGIELPFPIVASRPVGGPVTYQKARLLLKDVVHDQLRYIQTNYVISHLTHNARTTFCVRSIRLGQLLLPKSRWWCMRCKGRIREPEVLK